MTQLPLFDHDDEDAAAQKARAAQIYQRINTTAAANRDRWYPTSLSHYIDQPFKALIASMLSAQTREEQTTTATQALFDLADTPEALLERSDEQIMAAIRPVSYAGSKLRYLRDICTRLVENNGVVPQDVETLMQYKGVGWKVATLSLLIGYGRAEDIPVDVHVKRVGIRMGFVDPQTKKAELVSEQLKVVLPEAAWPRWNPLMVQFGREVCTGRAPDCAHCPVNDLCPKIGVNR
ncbi:MAG: endonuclease III domain-containing protein [Chloroflexota bacterium]